MRRPGASWKTSSTSTYQKKSKKKGRKTGFVKTIGKKPTGEAFPGIQIEVKKPGPSGVHSKEAEEKKVERKGTPAEHGHSGKGEQKENMGGKGNDVKCGPT